MPIVIELKFPGGRYHATPWGRHVNEGVAEWPPSPWRLLRALVAVWKRTLPDIPSEQVQRILAALTEPPQFKLPRHRVAHTRHYMPWEKKGPEDRTLVFDTFVAVNRDETLHIGWEHAALSADDLVMLNRLLENLSTLGRAEAWVEARLTSDLTRCDLTLADPADPNPIPVLCPDPSTVFSNDYYPRHDVKKLASGKINPANYLFDCPPWHLCLDTETIHAERWPTVPGSRWINYQRPQEITAVRVRPRPVPVYTVARFLLDAPVLPLITDTILVAEKFRAAVMSCFQKWCELNPSKAAGFARSDEPDRYSSRIFSGKELDGKSTLTAHRHAHYLPTAEGVDPRRITHVTIFARGGLGDAEVRSLASLRYLRNCNTEGESPRVQLVGLGQPTDFRGQLFQQSREFVSVTPFLGPAHVGSRTVEKDLKKAISKEWLRLVAQIPEYQGIELEDIEPIELTDPAWKGRPRPLEFRRVRSKHAHDGYRMSGIFRLRFNQEMVGPLPLGYASHYGLGLFRAET